MLVITMVLTSKGAAGVPSFAIIILSATLASAGLSLKGEGLIAGIFRWKETLIMVGIPCRCYSPF